MNEIKDKRQYWERVIVIIMMLLMMAAVTEQSHAATVVENSKGISVAKTLGAGSDGKTWTNPHFRAYPLYLFTVKFGGEEKYGYCFQSGKLWNSKQSYMAKRPVNASAWTNLSADRQRLLRLIMYYGYNNGKGAPVSGANTNDYFAATQVLIWEAADGDVTLSADGRWSKSTNKHDDLIAGRVKATQCYNWIKAEISAHVRGPSFASRTQSSAKTYTMKYSYKTGKWYCELSDSNRSRLYNRHSATTGAIAMSRAGYNYTFSTAVAGTGTAVVMNSDYDGTNQPLMVLKPANSGKQALLIGSEDTTYFYAKFVTEKSGTGIVTKKNSDGSSPAGFKFLVENEENGYSKIHTTDENGKITMDLYPGKYKLTELLTDEQKKLGFIEPAGGTLEITEGKVSEITLENIRKEIPYQIVKTSDNNVVEGFEFVISDDKGGEVARGKTSPEGIMEGKLFPGVYMVKEILTDEQIAAGYRAAKSKTFEISEKQSGTHVIRMHNLWDPIEGKIAIRKSTDDGGTEAGFVFEISGTIAQTGERFSLKKCVTDKTGQYLTDEIEPGTYTIKELLTDKQKERYMTPEPQTVEIKEKGQGAIVEFENKARRSKVALEKKSEDGHIAGVKFAITGTLLWGDEFEETIITTDDSGRCEIALQPGKYTFTETGENTDGYKKQPPKEISLTGNETEPVGIEFINIPNSITMVKTETLENGMKTDTPVKDAVYEVYRVDEYKGKEIHVDYGKFTTDEEGKFIVKGVAPGLYQFKEISAPMGYEVNETPAEIVFKIDDVGIRIEDSDKRAAGSITVIVRDDKGNPIEGSEIEIYRDEDCTDPIGTYTTDETGRIKEEDLPWGDYYVKETESPRGYEENDEVKKITIGKDGVTDAEYEIIKMQKKGKVLITKTDETESVLLENAVFSLYKTDGKLVSQGLRTDKKGRLLIEDLDWGSYYLQETQAPAGYGLKSDPVRFSVNATTGGRTQALNVINKAATSNIVINKRIKADDIHYDHGTPTFSFTLSGTTLGGEEKTYNRLVSFSKEYVKENIRDDGYVTASVIFDDLKAGEYTCFEKKALRYELAEISGVSDNGTISDGGSKVKFVLEGLDSGQATFTNEKSQWRDYSDSVSINNIIKAEKKLTSLAVEYRGPDELDGNMPFNGEDYLDVTAYYDDGSERALASEEYIMLGADGSVFDRTDMTAGDYTVTVHYSENNILRKESFSFKVKGAEQMTVKFETNGGSPLDDITLWKYDTLNDYGKDKTSTVKDGFRFTGWFKNADLTEAFTETEPVTENMTLYAGWDKKHLDDYTWNELKEISESGKAEQVLGECFETIKADIADDGRISAENYMHTKTFDCEGTLCHAMIAGFDHDIKADGSAAGISMIVYEPLHEENMITPETGRALGWKSSYMRNTVLADIYENLPQVMKNAISPVTKSEAVKNGNSISIEKTEDKLWLPSQTELFGAWGYDTWEPKVMSANYGNEDFGKLMSVFSGGSQYALFSGSVPDGSPSSEKALAIGSGYWTRSVDPSMDRMFCFVNGAGGAGSK